MPLDVLEEMLLLAGLDSAIMKMTSLFMLFVKTTMILFSFGKNFYHFESIGCHFFTIGSVSKTLGSYDDFMGLGAILKVLANIMITIVIEYVYCSFLFF